MASSTPGLCESWARAYSLKSSPKRPKKRHAFVLSQSKYEWNWRCIALFFRKLTITPDSPDGPLATLVMVSVTECSNQLAAASNKAFLYKSSTLLRIENPATG